MEFSIDTNNVLLEQQDQVESGEYNVTECSFIFSSEYEGLTKKAVFTGEDGTAYLQTIVDNKCSIPSEILEVSQVVEIGVYAYDVENEELVLRYSPEPTQFYIHQGSYKEAQNSTPPTPTEIEQLQSQITSNKNDIEEIQDNIVEINQTLGTIATDIEEITGDISDIKAEQITQNENIQKNTDDITDINSSIGTINSNINDIQGDISDIKAEQITQNGDIQTNANDISDIKGEQLTQNQNIQTNAQNISNETLNRQQADNNLQSQIDAITVSSDVIDVLGTYQDLQNYDTSHVKANDIIKVLQDSTHNDSMSYYRWVIVDHVGSWQYVGSEGPYYTKSETDTLLNTYVKNTDYATSSKGGVVKTNSYWGTAVNENGVLTGAERIYSTYQNAPNELLIAKGTLENVITGKNLETANNKVTELTDESTDTQYPSAKCVYDSQEEQNTEIEALQQENAELKQDITNMAKAMYKVDGQGSDITLQNTSENKFVEFGLEGRTEQEQYEGYNIFNKDTVVNNRYINATTGEMLELSGTSASDYINIEGIENLIMSGDTFMRTNGGAFYNSNKEYISGFRTQQIYDGINVPSGSFYVRVTTTTELLDVIQIEKGTTRHDYEPYCGGIEAPNPRL